MPQDLSVGTSGTTGTNVFFFHFVARVGIVGVRTHARVVVTVDEVMQGSEPLSGVTDVGGT
jgi:hypothetical protein